MKLMKYGAGINEGDNDRRPYSVPPKIIEKKRDSGFQL